MTHMSYHLNSSGYVLSYYDEIIVEYNNMNYLYVLK